MKLNHVLVITEAIENICLVTWEEPDKVIDALTGLCWDEEDAGQLKTAMIDEE